MTVRGIEFEAGGFKGRLHLGAGAMLKYERLAKAQTGETESVLEAAELLNEGKLSMERLVRMFQCAIQPEVNEAQAVEILEDLGFVPGMELLGKALEQTMTGLDEGDSGGN